MFHWLLFGQQPCTVTMPATLATLINCSHTITNSYFLVLCVCVRVRVRVPASGPRLQRTVAGCRS